MRDDDPTRRCAEKNVHLEIFGVSRFFIERRNRASFAGRAIIEIPDWGKQSVWLDRQDRSGNKQPLRLLQSRIGCATLSAQVCATFVPCSRRRNERESTLRGFLSEAGSTTIFWRYSLKIIFVSSR